MPDHPTSAVSVFTAVGCGICVVIGVVTVALGRAPAYILLWCAGVAVVGVVNLWISRAR
jgi:hypothetical protein